MESYPVDVSYSADSLPSGRMLTTQHTRHASRVQKPHAALSHVDVLTCNCSCQPLDITEELCTWGSYNFHKS